MTEFDYNNLSRYGAEGDRETQVQLGVYNGNASLTVFKGREIVAKIPMPVDGRVLFIRDANRILKGGPDTNQVRHIYKYNMAEKKLETVGTVVIGRNDKNICYIGISAPGFPGTRFPFRMGSAWGADEKLTEPERSEIALDAFIRVLEIEVPFAVNNTRVKRDFNKSGGSKGNSSGGYGKPGGSQGGSDDVF